MLPLIATLTQAAAKHHELTADLACFAIVLAELGYRLEVRHQLKQLDVALALPLQMPSRLHAKEYR
jgi:hypothetical protein